MRSLLHIALALMFISRHKAISTKSVTVLMQHSIDSDIAFPGIRRTFRASKNVYKKCLIS